jgi:hypothetical protein
MVRKRFRPAALSTRTHRRCSSYGRTSGVRQDHAGEGDRRSTTGAKTDASRVDDPSVWRCWSPIEVPTASDSGSANVHYGLRKGRLNQCRQSGVREFKPRSLGCIDPRKSIVLVWGPVRGLTSPFIDQPDIHSEVCSLHVSKRFDLRWCNPDTKLLPEFTGEGFRRRLMLSDVSSGQVP